jgi:hypothetical protein
MRDKDGGSLRTMQVRNFDLRGKIYWDGEENYIKRIFIRCILHQTLL